MNDEEMVKAYSDMIYGVAMRYVRNRTDADDVYSDVFYRYFRRERKFDSEEHRKAWLLRVTVNASKEFLMNRGYSEELSDDMFGDEPISASWDTSMEDVIAVREALRQLDGDYREIIELYYFNGLSTSEISAMLQKPVNTVKSQMLRGREKLKVLLSAS
ncbi:RNA polymerase sigma-70 factor, ECF subfamily [Ruminococcaceae bacterium FB2012]|nr:RNA polymerase sigma-70 factor, ECF subfamily [Ruminococcaceae bacterium FB2012]